MLHCYKSECKLAILTHTEHEIKYTIVAMMAREVGQKNGVGEGRENKAPIC